MGEWPRKVARHLIVRDVHPRLDEDEVGRFRCVRCGRVLDEIDPEELRRDPCGVVPYIRKPPDAKKGSSRYSRD